MSLKDIVNIVLAAIASVGGAGGIITLVVRFTANRIADSLEKKYEYKLEEKLEAYKSELNSKAYITQVQFDKEFQSYVNLVEKCNKMVNGCYSLFPTGLLTMPEDKEKRKAFYKDLFDESVNAYNSFSNELGSSAPFISQELFDGFNEIRQLCSLQINFFNLYGYHNDEHDKFIVEGRRECGNRTKEIIVKTDAQNGKIREYISSLSNKTIIPSKLSI